MDAPVVKIIGDHKPTYPSHIALEAALAKRPERIETQWTGTRTIADTGTAALADADGLLLAPGGYERYQGALDAITFAREREIPLTGA